LCWCHWDQRDSQSVSAFGDCWTCRALSTRRSWASASSTLRLARSDCAIVPWHTRPREHASTAVVAQKPQYLRGLEGAIVIGFQDQANLEVTRLQRPPKTQRPHVSRRARVSLSVTSLACQGRRVTHKLRECALVASPCLHHG